MSSLTGDYSKNEPQLPAAYDFVFFKKVDSLRAKAAELANKGCEEGRLIWTIEQRHAVARQSKTWVCNAGDLHCSILLRPEFEPSEDYQMLIVAIVSLGNSIATYVSPMTALGYQWPNDISVANHKIASVWVDQGQSNGNRWLSITLSVNVLNAPEDPLMNAISIREAQGSTDLNNKQLLESFAREFIRQINNWSQRGYGYIFKQWRMRLQNIDQEISLQDGERTVKAIVKNIDEIGNIEVGTGKQVRKITIQNHMGLSE